MRTFDTREEAMETLHKEYERTQVKSGILCKCECYRWGDNIRETEPIHECKFLLVPQDIYEKYEQHTREEDKDTYTSTAHVVVVHSGSIRVRLYPNGRDNYSVMEDLCKRATNVEELLEKYLGQKIRLGKNLLVRTSKRKHN